MKNPILEKRKLVQDRIEKSFNSGINVPEEVEMEKAHQDGEIHPNGKWVWVSSANGGKGDWRTRGGRTHNAHSENEKKFKQNFKNAQDGILQKIIDGKIQAGAHEKKWAQDILDERKKGSAGDKAAAKIIDLIKISNSKYSDISKVVAFKTDKGNWAIDYDGANTGLIIGKDHLSEAELKAAGVKIEGGSSKGDDDKSKQRAKTEQDTPQKVRDILKKKGYTPRTDGTWEHSDGREAFPDKNGKWVTTTKMPGVRMNVESMDDEPAKKKADPKQDKAAQAAGFKDYEEMKGWQDYTTAKNLLKKPSMKLKSKEADRKELEKQVADYEKDHSDVIAARGGKKSGPKTSNPTDHGNTEDNAYQAYKSGKITKEQYEGITGKKKDNGNAKVTNPKLVAAGETAAKNTAKLFVDFLNGDDESMEFNDHYIKLTQAIPNEEQRKKMVEDAIRKEMHDYVSPGSPDEDKAVKEFWENLDTEAIKGSKKSAERKAAKGDFSGKKLTEILDGLDDWDDDDWNDQALNKKLDAAIKTAIKNEGIDEKKFKEIAKKYQGLDLVYEDYVDKKKPAIKYSEMTAAQANKTLVGKTIKIGDKTAKIMNAFKSSGPGSNKVYLEVVDGDDYLGSYMQISLDAVDSGETKYDNKYFGTKGQKIEIGDEEPDKKEVTKESFKEFLNYMQKNIAKKDSNEFLNKEYMFLFTVPQKYRSSAGNVHNRVAATIKKLSDANNW